MRAVAGVGGYFGLNDGLAGRRIVRAEHGRERQAVETDFRIGNVDGRIVGQTRRVETGSHRHERVIAQGADRGENLGRSAFERFREFLDRDSADQRVVAANVAAVADTPAAAFLPDAFDA